MTLQEVIDRLRPLGNFLAREHLSVPEDISPGLARAEWCAAHKHEATDVVLVHPGMSFTGADDDGWSFADMSAVAEALGTKDIDIAAVVGVAAVDGMERLLDGCPTCGNGDGLIIRGILRP